MTDDRPGVPALDGSAPSRGPTAPRAPAGASPVVVADDDRANVARIARILGEAGHPVFLATGGRSALRQVLASSVSPALLVCAIEMHEMSGIELAARVSAARPGVRVLLLSADPRSVELARDRTTLVHGVLLKPFTTDELWAAIRAALGSGP
jgi:two-component system cell cycle response regulator CpdR